jgi:hypothetical protein
MLPGRRLQHLITGNNSCGACWAAPAATVVEQHLHFFSSQPASSSIRLARPVIPPEEPDARRKWRSHAVSLEIGDYVDDYEDEELPSASAAAAGDREDWEEEELDLAHQVQEIQRQEDLKKQRWLENAKPPVRHPVIDERGRAYGRGFNLDLATWWSITRILWSTLIVCRTENTFWRRWQRPNRWASLMSPPLSTEVD